MSGSGPGTKVRVRFAPSPTGPLHVGNARTALFNWAYARATGGTMILRIEDTDLRRSSDESARAIMENLRWLGVDWDEGPDVGGAAGPYVQSQRIDIYRTQAQNLVSRGRAYRCYCVEADLQSRRKETLRLNATPRYDNRCRSLTPEQVSQYESEGRPHVLRFRVDEREVLFNDMVKGEVRFDAALIGDFVIMRADGTPSFHFAVTVDDGLMGVTHVIRGDDHLSNTPRHILLFKALGFPIPRFAHMSLTTGKGGAPLSKRLGDMSVASFRTRGFLPAALGNYIALLGWSPGKEREIFPLQELAKRFNPEQLSKAPSVFDPAKLRWVARQHMKIVEPAALAEMAQAWLKALGIDVAALDKSERERLRDVMALVREEAECLEEAAARCVQFFSERVVVEGGERALLLRPESHSLLETGRKTAAEFLENGGDAERFLEELQKRTSLRGKDLYAPIRIALTGTTSGMELRDIVRLLGMDRVASRFEKASESGHGE
ncbi:MAG: glutamate--tRNA ligase [Candidatus Aureabacteria bacterium]|nr:glutamate--tRNA ligase [Candidatus Auribacterota bacterium]